MSDQIELEASEQPWRVCQTHSGQEKLALENLDRQKFTAYLPLHLVQIAPRGQPVCTVSSPLFPGYIFVQVDPLAVRWRAIHSTRGLKSVLSAPVKHKLVARIQAKEIDGYVQLEKATPPACKWHPGDLVTFDGFMHAIFQEPVDARRALILVSLFGIESLQDVALARLS